VCGNKVCHARHKTGPKKSEEDLKEDEVGSERIGKKTKKSGQERTRKRLDRS
jgi:hypothetical protein